MSRSKKQIEQEEASEGAPEWMTTYSDLVTLLLTFFILLFSMAVIDKQKFEEVATSLRSAFMNNSNGELMHYNKGKEVISITTENNPQSNDSKEIDSQKNKNSDGKSQGGKDNDKGKKEKGMEEFKEEIEKLIVGLDLDKYVKIIDEKTYVILRIDSVILFDLGKADIKDSGKETLKKIGKLLKDLDSGMIVQGHTDNLPINTVLFPTNWELSTKRATNVVLFLIRESEVDPTKLTATGNGEFRPIAPNDTEENRQKNRRIDIVIDK
ncbi:MAG: flagellar motor protein MotB [Bacillota bacterium]